MIAPSPGMRETSPALVDLLVGLLEYRDPHHRGGSSLARNIAVALGRELGLDAARLSHLTLAALLRDLGRTLMGGQLIPPRAEVDALDQRSIERHLDTGLELLQGIPLPAEVEEAIRHHHERWDGGGYPAGLAGQQIPLLARILAVADALAAMISPRAHRPPRRLARALEELKYEAGCQHDPEVVRALARLLEQGERGGLAFLLQRRVALAHPDSHTAAVLATKLGSKGYMVDVNASPNETADCLQRSPVDVLVLAADMPGCDPVDLVSALRESDRFRELATIVVRVPRPEQRARLLEAGADVCLPEDVGAGELCAILASLRRRSSPPADDGRPLAPAAAGIPPHLLQGDLRTFPLDWLLQALQYDARTASIHVRAPEGEGTIVLTRGNPVHATASGLSGEDALRSILGWSKGRFTVRPPPQTQERTIDRPLMHFLLDEAAKADHAIFGAVGVYPSP